MAVVNQTLDEKPTFWSCPRCTFLNMRGSTHCSMCEASAQHAVVKQVRKDSGWSCPKCTFINAHSITRCSMCEGFRLYVEVEEMKVPAPMWSVDTCAPTRRKRRSSSPTRLPAGPARFTTCDALWVKLCMIGVPQKDRVWLVMQWAGLPFQQIMKLDWEVKSQWEELSRRAENANGSLDVFDPQDLRRTDMYGKTALHYAAENGLLSVSRAMLEAIRPVFVDTMDNHRQTPLLLSCPGWHNPRRARKGLRQVRLLLKHGADPTAGAQTERRGDILKSVSLSPIDHMRFRVRSWSDSESTRGYIVEALAHMKLVVDRGGRIMQQSKKEEEMQKRKERMQRISHFYMPGYMPRVVATPLTVIAKNPPPIRILS